MRKAAGEGEVHLDAQLQAEWYKIQEEAKSKTSKLRTDHEALKATQARPLVCFRPPWPWSTSKSNSILQPGPRAPLWLDRCTACVYLKW